MSFLCFVKPNRVKLGQQRFVQTAGLSWTFNSARIQVRLPFTVSPVFLNFVIVRLGLVPSFLCYWPQVRPYKFYNADNAGWETSDGITKSRRQEMEPEQSRQQEMEPEHGWTEDGWFTQARDIEKSRKA